MGDNKWLYLENQDKVFVIAPSAAPNNLSNIPDYIHQISKVIHDLSFGLEIADDLIAKDKDLFCANSLEFRFKNFVDAINSDCKAIWAIRGGYGSSKLIPFLQRLPTPKQTKLIVGFSDITALHLFVQKFWQWPSLHGPVLNQFADEEHKLTESLELTKKVLTGELEKLEYNQFIPLNDAAKKSISIFAKITGGNLSIVQTSLATIWEIDSENKIIFLEDVSEAPYRIDRMLNHLLQAGVFSKVKALIFGSFSPYDNDKIMNQLLVDFAEQMDVPVIKTNIFGHNSSANMPLFLGADCTLQIENDNINLICNTDGIFAEEINVK